MFKMEYYHLAEKLNLVRVDIKALRKQQATTIKGKILLLKETNNLLREQNKLLTLRQKVLAQRQQAVR